MTSRKLEVDQSLVVVVVVIVIIVMSSVFLCGVGVDRENAEGFR